MNSLENLYSATHCDDSSVCEGCTILLKNKPVHSVLDYKEIDEAPVLFLSDSLKYQYGSNSAFSAAELTKVLEPATKFIPEGSIAYSAAVKCPDVRESDMSPANMILCRQHLSDTIDKIKPKLVFVCGNLAMKMLVKKSGITTKRGKSFDYESLTGHKCVVVPIYHPYSIIKEPSHKELFNMDIRNAYAMYIEGKRSDKKFFHHLIMEFSELDGYDYLRNTDQTIAVDIETTGLNFLQDSITTIAISCGEDNIVIPIDHKDTPFIEGDRFAVFKWLSYVAQNPNNKKVFHNSKFDQKFLFKHGIRFVNVWDTKIMSHLLNENMPKGLMDLVKAYFPMELESL